jgi:rfaE bifunctional protein kinase chain/domain
MPSLSQPRPVPRKKSKPAKRAAQASGSKEAGGSPANASGSLSSPTADPRRLAAIVRGFSGVTVTVLADLVADEFVFGEIARVSREAPVLILKHRESHILPGGGGNAICNLADLGVGVLPVGIVGDDAAGQQLLHEFHRRRISTSAITKLSGYETVRKTRILAGHPHSARQQVVRLDREPQTALTGRVLRGLAESAREYAAASDAFLISDYGYGAASPDVWNAIRESINGIPVTLDSRYRMLQYQGVTAATPNESEVEEALRIHIAHHQERLVASGRALVERMQLASLVITRGRDGMVAFPRRGEPIAIPISGADEVADVTGAGDTVIATFTAALATGADAVDAARLANIAGGIVVMKRGTATVTRAELLAAVERGA